MIKLNYTGTVTRRVEGFGKFAPGSSVSVSEEDVEILLGTKLFKRTTPPKKTEGKDASPPEKKKEVPK